MIYFLPIRLWLWNLSKKIASRYMECMIDCAGSLFEKNCQNDPEAATFFKEMSTAGAMIMLHDLNAFDQALGLGLMPNECRAFAPEDGELQPSTSDNLL